MKYNLKDIHKYLHRCFGSLLTLSILVNVPADRCPINKWHKTMTKRIAYFKVEIEFVFSNIFAD